MKKTINKNTKSYKNKILRKEKKIKLKEWSLKVKNRDHNRCVICVFYNLKPTTDILHAHHIFPKEIEKYRFEVDNGITLCPRHHKYSFEISAHRNSYVFYQWLLANRKDQLDRLMLIVF